MPLGDARVRSWACRRFKLPGEVVAGVRDPVLYGNKVANGKSSQRFDIEPDRVAMIAAVPAPLTQEIAILTEARDEHPRVFRGPSRDEVSQGLDKWPLELLHLREEQITRVRELRG